MNDYRVIQEAFQRGSAQMAEQIKNELWETCHVQTDDFSLDAHYEKTLLAAKEQLLERCRAAGAIPLSCDCLRIFDKAHNPHGSLIFFHLQCLKPKEEPDGNEKENAEPQAQG